MDYSSIRGEYLTDYAKKTTWNLLPAYISAHSQILIDEYTEYGVQDISRLQPQFANMTFADQNIYNRLFHKLIHKGVESAINYIKYFRTANFSRK